MRKLIGTLVVASGLLTSGPWPALAADGSQAAAQPDSGWSGVVYPVYGWLPVHRATTRLPEIPEDGGTVTPEGETDASLQSAFLAAFRLEKGWFALEGGYLYAGLSGEAERPLVKIDVNTNMADLRAGAKVLPDFYLEGGVRWLALDVSATVGSYETQDWSPSVVEPVIGITYRPLVLEGWRLVLHGDIGGLGTGDTSSAHGSIRVEWQPVKHFLLALGGTVSYVKIEGTIGRRDIELEQTLYGPILGIGIPF